MDHKEKAVKEADTFLKYREYYSPQERKQLRTLLKKNLLNLLDNET